MKLNRENSHSAKVMKKIWKECESMNPVVGYLVAYECRKVIDLEDNEKDNGVNIRSEVHVCKEWNSADKLAKGIMMDSVVMANINRQAHSIVSVWCVTTMPLGSKDLILQGIYKLYANA